MEDILFLYIFKKLTFKKGIGEIRMRHLVSNMTGQCLFYVIFWYYMYLMLYFVHVCTVFAVSWKRKMGTGRNFRQTVFHSCR